MTTLQGKREKTDGMVAVMRSTLINSIAETFKMLYQSFVRPHLGYAKRVQKPQLKQHIITLKAERCSRNCKQAHAEFL